jgi:DNA replication protein DnaC
VSANYQKVATESLVGKKDYTDYLLALMEQEALNREANALRNRISAARFPVIKGLDTFDFSAVAAIN